MGSSRRGFLQATAEAARVFKYLLVGLALLTVLVYCSYKLAVLLLAGMLFAAGLFAGGILAILFLATVFGHYKLDLK